MMRERDQTRAPCRVLLPRVTAAGREWRRCWQGCLKVRDLPEGIGGPFALRQVQPWGEPRWQSLMPGCQRGQLCGEVEIPLRCWVEDACGCMHTGTACLIMDACVRPEGRNDEMCGSQWIMQACVGLRCPPARSAAPCFEVDLEISLEINGVRWQRFASQREEKCDLPLYPPPCRY